MSIEIYHRIYQRIYQNYNKEYPRWNILCYIFDIFFDRFYDRFPLTLIFNPFVDLPKMTKKLQKLNKHKLLSTFLSVSERRSKRKIKHMLNQLKHL